MTRIEWALWFVLVCHTVRLHVVAYQVKKLQRRAGQR